MCSVVYTPTSCITLRCICNISDVFRQYREHPLFTEICVQMDFFFFFEILEDYSITLLFNCLYGSKG